MRFEAETSHRESIIDDSMAMTLAGAQTTCQSGNLLFSFGCVDVTQVSTSIKWLVFV